MVSLPELSIRRPVFAWMIMVALMVFGAIAFKRMGISQLPDVDFPVVSVNLTLQGAAPEVMEGQVIDPIEDAVMQIEGIRNVTSTASQSSGSISLEFELNRDIDQAVQEVQNRIKQVLNLMPTGLLPPTVRKSNPEDQPILWVALVSDASVRPIDLMIYARNTLLNQFATVEGVGDVNLGGYVDPALRVWLDQNKLKKNELTSTDVLTAINSEQVELPAGRIENDKREFNVRVRGEAASAEDFGKIRIQRRSGGINYKATPLSEIATIEEGTADVRKIARFNGQPAIGLGIQKQHGSNAVDVAKRVYERLELVKKTLPKAYSVSIRSDQTRFIKQSVDQLNFTLLLSALLTSVVCFFFLGSWTSTVNVLMAIPTSIIGTFIVLYFMGFTLNTFTLLGLSLAIGIVVDDAIMMLENIVRHREKGESKRRAALRGSEEIKFAAVAATVAVCAIFLPVIFMKGVIGKFFFQYGITVTAAVLLSLLEALTLTPMRCSRFLKVEPPKGLNLRIERFFHHLAEGYGRILDRILRRRWAVAAVLLGTTALFVGSLLLAKLLASEMIPAQDQSTFILRIKGPVGAAIQLTDDKMRIAEKWIQAQPETEGLFTLVGGFGGDAVNQGIFNVTLVPPHKRKLNQQEVMKKFREGLQPLIKPYQAIGQDLSMRGFTSSRGFPVEFTVQGPDWDKLFALSQELLEKISASGVIVDANTDIQKQNPEIHVKPNRQKLAAHGVGLQSVTSAMNTLIGGALLNGQIQYPKDGHRYEIEVRLPAEQRNEVDQLRTIKVPNNRGENVALADLVDLVSEPALQQISRLNRSRAITIYGNVAPGHSQREGLDLVQKIAKDELPPGYYTRFSGSAQSFKESFDSLIYALLLGILVSYMVLASQFNSFVHPVSVLMALPFSISGALIALLVAHQSLNIYSLIGFILLMGIVKKNSILLVDFTNLHRREGKSPVDALIAACPVRLRPILMTSTAVIVGALPEALSLGPGAETTVPMAVGIIGGVLASTILTLFVVPCVYLLLVRIESKENLDPEFAALSAALNEATDVAGRSPVL